MTNTGLFYQREDNFIVEHQKGPLQRGVKVHTAVNKYRLPIRLGGGGGESDQEPQSTDHESAHTLGERRGERASCMHLHTAHTAKMLVSCMVSCFDGSSSRLASCAGLASTINLAISSKSSSPVERSERGIRGGWRERGLVMALDLLPAL